MLTSDPLPRRTFLRTAAAAGVAATSPVFIRAKALGLENQAAASERITLGVVGYGPRCKYDLAAMLQLPDVQCVAMCDVQANRREEGKAAVDTHYGNSDCTAYRDFREMLARDDIDAVLVATGDRWHADASILAVEAGKDVYSEKPCGITIERCQALSAAVERTGRVFQAGTQRRNVPNFQTAVELAHRGAIGKLKTLVASVYTPGIETAWLPGEPTPDPAVVDWNLWLGPAPWRPYNQRYVEGRWRGYYDFDSGAKLLDWGAHTVDLCQWANQADDTMPVEYTPEPNRITAKYANGVTLVLDFLATPFAQRPGWTQSLGTCPVKFIGEGGSIETGDDGGIVADPPSVLEGVAQKSRVRGLDVGLHARDFFDCVKSRGKPAANADVMRRSHVACHAAALAWILQRPLRIDPATERFIDDDEANRLQSRPRRDWA